MILHDQKGHKEPSFAKPVVYFQEIKESNNIRAELRSVFAALKACPTDIKITLVTDCQAIVNLPLRREKLETSNFISVSKNRELTNADLYRIFYSLYDRYRPEIIWVKGHTSKPQNQIQKNFSFLDKEVRKRLRLRTNS